MGDTQVHVYTDPDGARNNSTAPSSVPVSVGTVGAAAATVGSAMAGAVDAGYLFLFSPSLAASPAQFAPPAVQPTISEGYVYAVIGFGLLTLGLATFNLFYGLARKRKWQADMRAHQSDLDTLCKKAKVLT